MLGSLENQALHSFAADRLFTFNNIFAKVAF